MLVDKDKGIIGLPINFYDGIDICNKYYVFELNEEGLKQSDVLIETHDVNKLYSFERAIIKDADLFAFSQGRIVGVNFNTPTEFRTVNLIEPSTVSSHN